MKNIIITTDKGINTINTDNELSVCNQFCGK